MKYYELIYLIYTLGIGMTNDELKKLKKMMYECQIDEKVSYNSSGLGMGLLVSNKLAKALG